MYCSVVMRTSDKARAFGCKILYFNLSSEHQLNKFTWFKNWFSFHRLLQTEETSQKYKLFPLTCWDVNSPFVFSKLSRVSLSVNDNWLLSASLDSNCFSSFCSSLRWISLKRSQLAGPDDAVAVDTGSIVTSSAWFPPITWWGIPIWKISGLEIANNLLRVLCWTWSMVVAQLAEQLLPIQMSAVRILSLTKFCKKHVFCNLLKKTKIKKKRPGIANYLKRTQSKSVQSFNISFNILLTTEPKQKRTNTWILPNNF